MLINSPNISGSLTVTGNATISGSLNVAGGISAAITGSATSASYVEYSNVANKPTLVSGSTQVSFNGITDKPTLVSGSSQVTYSGLSGIPAGIVSGSAQVSFNGITDKPTLVSGSEQVSFNGIVDKPTLVSGSSQVTYSGLSGIPSGIVSSSAQVGGYGIFATTGSNSFNGSQVVTGSLTVTGQVVAQTLNVQQVTSSIVFSSGSNIFGNSLANTQQFTGSVSVTGSLAVTSSMSIAGDGSNDMFKAVRSGVTRVVIKNGVNTLGINTDTINNPLTVNGGADFSGNVGIGVTGPSNKLEVVGAGLFGSHGTGSYSLAISNNDQSNVRLRITNAGSGGQSFSIVGGNPGVSNAGLAIFDETNSLTRLYVASGGNVGIGVTDLGPDGLSLASGLNYSWSEGSGNAYAVLFRQRNTAATVVASGYKRSDTGGFASSYGTSMARAAIAVGYNNGSIAFFSDSATNVANGTDIAPTERLTILNTGNVGIGTSGPVQKLHVEGSTAIGTTGTEDILILGRALGNGVSFQQAASLKLGRYQNAGGNYESYTRLDFALRDNSAASNYNTNTTVMTLTNAGRVGIGTTNPDRPFELYNATTIGLAMFRAANENGAAITIKNDQGSNDLSIYSAGSTAFGVSGWANNGIIESATGIVYSAYNGNHIFQSGVSGRTERMRITSGGFLKVSNTGAYADANSSYHEILSNQGDTNNIKITNTHGSSPYGPWLYHTTNKNNGTNYFLVGEEGSNVRRFAIFTNGGLANYQANDTNLSDERTKKDIAPLESYWDKFKAIEIVKFKYKDQTHDDYNIGVIAQQVEQVAPEFVDIDGWNTRPKLDEEGNIIVSEEEPLKSIYTADLHHATIKVLQEAMAKIESLEAILQRNNLL